MPVGEVSEFINTNIPAATLGGGKLSKTNEERQMVNFIRSNTFQ